MRIALLRSSALLVCALLATACGAHLPPATPPALPLPPAWKTLLGDFVASPLAYDGRRIFVATRTGTVRALQPDSGQVLWTVEGRPGRLSAASGALLVRESDGMLSSLHPRTGAVRWQSATGIAGDLPALLDGERVFVAGDGVAAVDLTSGRLLWTQRSSGAATTAPPVVLSEHLLVGQSDGALRCLDARTGAVRWTLPTRGALLAPPLLDPSRGRGYLGTTDGRVLAFSLRDGHAGWRWKVGADVAHPGLLRESRVLFASHDAVLSSLHAGGNLAWRAGLPSRPLSGPIEAAGGLWVACLEKDLVIFDPVTGTRLGSFATPSEIRTPPLAAATVLVLGLRDRSVVAYALPGYEAPTASEPAAAPPDGE